MLIASIEVEPPEAFVFETRSDETCGHAASKREQQIAADDCRRARRIDTANVALQHGVVYGLSWRCAEQQSSNDGSWHRYAVASPPDAMAAHTAKVGVRSAWLEPMPQRADCETLISERNGAEAKIVGGGVRQQPALAQFDQMNRCHR